MAGVTPEGFVRKTESEIFDDLIAEQRSTISPSIDDSSDSLNGVLVGIQSSKHAELWEVAEDVYNSFGPNASGAGLDRICELTGTTRNPPTYSEVTATVNVNVGTYAAGTIIATVQDNPNARFVSTQDAVRTGTTGSVNVLMRADTAGAVVALAGTLVNLESPPAGVNSITIVADANVGADVEKDPALRVRRKQELSDPGQTTLGALRGALSKLAGVEQYKVYTNRTATTDGDGRPAKSFEVVILGANTDQIAQCIWDNMPLGIESYSYDGSGSGVATDEEGNIQVVDFSRATELRLYCRATIKIGTGYPGASTVQQRIADFTDGTINVVTSDGKTLSGEVDIGGTVYPSQIQAAVQTVAGVLSVTSIELSTDGSTWSTASVALTARQYLGHLGSTGIQTADVTVVAT